VPVELAISGDSHALDVLLQADEEFDMLVSSKIIQLTAGTDKQGGSTQEDCLQQLCHPQQPHDCSTPLVLCRRPAMLRVSALEQQQQNHHVLSLGSRPQSARKVYSLTSESSRFGNSYRGASAAVDQTSCSSNINHNEAHCDLWSRSVASSGVNQHQGQIEKHGANSETTTPRSIALVCQASLRHRQHSLHTLSSLMQVHGTCITSAEHLQSDPQSDRDPLMVNGSLTSNEPTQGGSHFNSPGEIPWRHSSTANGGDWVDRCKDLVRDNDSVWPSEASRHFDIVGRQLPSAHKTAVVAQFGGGFAVPSIIRQPGAFACDNEETASAGDLSNELEAILPSTLWLPSFNNSRRNNRHVSAAQ